MTGPASQAEAVQDVGVVGAGIVGLAYAGRRRVAAIA